MLFRSPIMTALRIQSSRKLRASSTLSIKILLKMGHRRPITVLEIDRKKISASFERNPEMNGSSRRTREKLTVLRGLIQFRPQKATGDPITRRCER